MCVRYNVVKYLRQLKTRRTVYFNRVLICVNTYSGNYLGTTAEGSTLDRGNLRSRAYSQSESRKRNSVPLGNRGVGQGTPTIILLWLQMAVVSHFSANGDVKLFAALIKKCKKVRTIKQKVFYFKMILKGAQSVSIFMLFFLFLLLNKAVAIRN